MFAYPIRSRLLWVALVLAVLAGSPAHAQDCAQMGDACGEGAPCCASLICVDGMCQSGIRLMERVGDAAFIPTVGNEGLGVFGYYFNLLYPWVVGMGAATAILNGVIGGIQIIQAGSGDGVKNGKNRLLLSFAGLLIILAAAAILNAINPVFYQ